MTPEFDAEAHCDHMARVMGLTIAPEWREGVVENLATTARIAGLVISFPLDDRIEPAPAFEA